MWTKPKKNHFCNRLSFLSLPSSPVCTFFGRRLSTFKSFVSLSVQYRCSSIGGCGGKKSLHGRFHKCNLSARAFFRGFHNHHRPSWWCERERKGNRSESPTDQRPVNESLTQSETCGSALLLCRNTAGQIKMTNITKERLGDVLGSQIVSWALEKEIASDFPNFLCRIELG